MPRHVHVLWIFWWVLSRASSRGAVVLYIRRLPRVPMHPHPSNRRIADRPLVMVGDSLTRYQFISLIHWLELGSWPPSTTGTPEHPSPVIEREWAINDQETESWPRYFRGGPDARCQDETC